MRPNVVSEEYLNLQKGIIEVQGELKEELLDKLDFALNKDEINVDKIIISQLKESPVPVDLYKNAIDKIGQVASSQSEDISKELEKMNGLLTDDVLHQWIKAAVTFDANYFETFSKENAILPWLPYFIAEQAIRPFLQVISHQSHMIMDKMKVIGSCPCCGEPARLAKLNKDREKFLLCPRCETEKRLNRLACVHCRNENHEELFYIEIEEDKVAKVEVCKSCQNYTKLIDAGQLFKPKPAALFDLETIHLDFIAQEEGYGGEEN